MLQNLRRADEKFYKNSLRIGEYGAFELYKEQTNDPNGIITPETRDEAWNRSQGRVMQMTVLDPNTNITISNTRSCVITDAENTSKQVTVNFVFVGFGFTMVPTLYHNNQIGYEQDFRTKFRTGEDAMGNAIDQLCVANLALGQSQYFKEDLGYTITGNSVQVPYTKRTNIFGDLKGMMRANKFRAAEMDIVGNAGCEAILRNLGIFGPNNAQNLDGERRGNRLHYSNNVANATATQTTSYSGACYAVAPGMVGMLTRVSRAELYKLKSIVGHEWDTVELPGLGLMVGSHYYQSVGDMSAIAGAASADMVCDMKEHFSFGVEIALLTAYNAAIATQANPIIKVDFEESANPTIAFPVKTVS
jgi:hypothetical protein